MFKKIFAFLSIANDTKKNEQNESYFNSLLNMDLSKSMNSGKFENYFSEYYLNQNDNLTEQKYKLFCLHAFLDYKEIYVSSMPSLESVVNDISKKLLENGETKYDLNNLFNKDLSLSEVDYDFRVSALRELQEETNLIIPIIDNSVDLIKILEEDKDNDEKLRIAKRVYQDFNNCGLLADKLRKNKNYLEVFLDLQNYKLEANDYKSLDKYVEKGNIDFYRHPYTELSVWNKIIDNEDSVEKLNKIKNFIVAANNASFGFDTHVDDEKEIIDHINSKIQYFELHGEMTEVKDTKAKPKKLKI